MQDFRSILEQKRPLIVCSQCSVKTTFLYHLAKDLRDAVVHVVVPDPLFLLDGAQNGYPFCAAHQMLNDIQSGIHHWVLHAVPPKEEDVKRLLSYVQTGFGALVGLQGWSVVEALEAWDKDLCARWMGFDPVGVDVHRTSRGLSYHVIDLKMTPDGKITGTSLTRKVHSFVRWL